MTAAPRMSSSALPPRSRHPHPQHHHPSGRFPVDMDAGPSKSCLSFRLLNATTNNKDSAASPNRSSIHNRSTMPSITPSPTRRPTPNYTAPVPQTDYSDWETFEDNLSFQRSLSKNNNKFKAAATTINNSKNNNSSTKTKLQMQTQTPSTAATSSTAALSVSPPSRNNHLKKQSSPTRKIATFSNSPGHAKKAAPPPPPQQPSSLFAVDLLTPPQPQDRSHKLKYEQSQRKKLGSGTGGGAGVYDGELEPIGKRGQEAMVVVLVPPDDDVPRANRRPATIRHMTPLVVSTKKKSPPRLAKIPDVIKEESDDDNDNDSDEHSSPQQQQHQLRQQRQESTNNSLLQFNDDDGSAVDCVRFSAAIHDPPRRAVSLSLALATATAAARGTITKKPPGPEEEEGAVVAGGGFEHPPPGHMSSSSASSSSLDNEKEMHLLRQDLMRGVTPSPNEDRRSPLFMTNHDHHDHDHHYPSPAAAQAAARAAQRYARGSRQSGAMVMAAAASTPNLPSSTTSTEENEPDDDNTSNSDNSSNNINRLNTRAMKGVQTGDFATALACFERVLHLYIVRHGTNHASVASAHHNLGTVHVKRAAAAATAAPLLPEAAAQLAARAQALAHFQAAARTARDALSEFHPNVAVSLVRIGFLLLQSRQYHNAILTFQEALRIRLHAYGSQHGLVANLYNNLGVCHMHLGQFEPGRDYLEQALTIQRQLPRDEAATDKWICLLELADTLFNIGGLCLEWIRRQGPDARRAIDAEKAFEEALQIRTQVLGPSDPSVLQVQALLDMALEVPRPKQFTSKLSPTARRRQSVSPTAASRARALSPKPSAVTPIQDAMDQDAAPDSTIFRSERGGSPTERRDPSESRRPPLPVVSTVSADEGDKEERGPGTQIYISPHLIPATPPRLKNAMNESDMAVRGHSMLDEELEPDINDEPKLPSNRRIPRSFSYDNEENCLISETGVDSEHGRIHYPPAWNKAGILPTKADARSGPDIMVTQPYRASPDAMPPVMQLDSSAASGRLNNDEGLLGSEVRPSSGTSARDDVLARARAILSAHSTIKGSLSSSPPRRELDEPDFDVEAPLRFEEQDVSEDGVAPLGGKWAATEGTHGLNEMIQDPMNHLPAIHDAASRFLQDNNGLSSQRYFEVVLDCQRRRNGQLHEDVAAALYNVGLAFLRCQNHEQALKAFEETARIRKGSLGREHPLVAVSLVKVGIILLVLRRFEEALWSFREALTVRKRSLGPLHPSTARIYNSMGCVHIEFNEFREARRAFEAALDIQRNALSQNPESGPLMFGTATTLCNLGYLYRFRDMYQKASLVLKEAVDLQENVLGPKHATVLSTLDNLADACANSGQHLDALKYYHTVLDRFQSEPVRSGKMHRAEAVLLYKMSRVHRQRNDREAQLEVLKRAQSAFRSYQDVNPEQSSDTGTLERRIQSDIRACREATEVSELNEF